MSHGSETLPFINSGNFSAPVCAEEGSQRGVRLLSLESPACKGDLWLTSGDMGFRRVPATSGTCCDESVCANNMVYAEPLRDRGCWHEQLPIKTPGPGVCVLNHCN